MMMTHPSVVRAAFARTLMRVILAADLVALVLNSDNETAAHDAVLGRLEPIVPITADDVIWHKGTISSLDSIATDIVNIILTSLSEEDAQYNVLCFLAGGTPT